MKGKLVSNPNPLDTSHEMLIRRRKERATPKVKKLTPLKKIILLEREQRVINATDTHKGITAQGLHIGTHRRLATPPSSCSVPAKREKKKPKEHHVHTRGSI